MDALTTPVGRDRNCRARVLSAVMAVLGLLLLNGAATAGADVERGEQIAAQRCGVCHATGASGASPHRITPPFRTLHERYPIEMLVEAARTGVVSGHDEMPMFQFTPEDARALVGYIDSLSPVNARYLAPPRK